VTTCSNLIIADRRDDTVYRQQAIIERMYDLRLQLLDIDPARAHCLPDVPLDLDALAQMRASQTARARKNVNTDNYDTIGVLENV
jgi:hypothetical protein